MKTKLLLLFFLQIFISIEIYSQNNELFRDDFNDNAAGWKLVTNSSANWQINNGYMIMQNKSTGAGMFYCFWKNVGIIETEDFSIETKVKQTAGAETSGYGVLWGASSWGNSYGFQINSAKQFTVWKYESDSKTTIVDWTSNPLIKGKNEWNQLAMECKSGTINFYINGMKVFTTPFQSFHGNLDGFVVSENMSVWADYLLVKQKKPEIEVNNQSITGDKKENIGNSMSTSYSEIAPIVTADGKTIYFARQYNSDNVGGSDNFDIWYSTQNADGKWSKAVNIGKPLNNKGDNVVISATADGNSLLLEGLYNADGSHKNDDGISITYRTENGWSVPKQVMIKNYYNNNEYESFTHSTDRRVLIMSVQRNDSYGSGTKDLYVSFLQDDGTYSEPKHMGNKMNTTANEGTPFLAADDKTLYFYSQGLPGYGDADIFVIKRTDDTWLNWTSPKNLGNLVNSSSWDTYFSISAKGDWAYLVSSKDSYGNEDIFQIKLKDDIKPDPVVLVYGKVYNQKTKKPMKASISYENLNIKKDVGTAISDPLSGSYKIILPYGKLFGYRAIATDFYSVSENIDLTNIKEYKEIKMDLYLIPIEVGENIVMKNVFFVRGKPELVETSYPELDRLVQLMKDNPKIEIELSGHTENVGPADKLLKLSEDRVAAVKKYLTEKGINEKRITGKGYGGTKTIASDETDEGRAKNRRVEFKILKK